MQTLFAYRGTESDVLTKDEKFLLHSIDSMYTLYLTLLAFLTELQKKSISHDKKLQNRLLTTTENPTLNTKFSNNAILNSLSSNTLLQEYITKQKLNFWDIDFEYVDIIFKAILKSSIYNAYVNSTENTFDADKQFVINVYTEIIAPNDKLYEYFEDKQLTWIDDIPVVNTNIIKLIKKLKPTSPETLLTPNLYKDEDDQIFAKDLFKKTVLNNSKFVKEISQKTTNWDSERLASLDGVLLKMAICEFQKFPSIPTKVTINEYLEIAKAYSTPKSSVFINGVLDKIVKEYQTKNIHTKAGRGLM